MMYGFHDMYNYYIIGLFLLIGAAILVASDASKRGYNGTLWAFIVILMPMMGLFFYLIYIAISNDDNNRRRSSNHSIRNFNNYPQSTPNNSVPSKGNLTSIFCTSCGKLNHDVSIYCKYCGTEII